MNRTRLACVILLPLVSLPGTSRAEGTHAFERSRVTAADASIGDNFGEVVALAGTTAVVGAPGSDASGLTDSGAAYVLEERAGAWTQVARLLPSAPVANGGFGSAVAMTPETIVVGTREPGPSPGSAYVFERSGTTWVEVAQLRAHDPSAGASFGHDVAIETDTILVGAPFDDAPHANSGSAYVFVKTNGLWAFQKKLTPRTSGSAGYHFGTSVGLLEDIALISYPGFANNDGRGPIDEFRRTGDTWDDGRRLTHPYLYGWDLAASGDQFAVPAGGYIGVYSLGENGWTWDQLSVPDFQPDDQFGYSLALDGDRLLVGSRRSDAAAIAAGSVYTFERVGTTWSLAGRQESSDAAMGDWFHAVALDGTRALVGAPRSDAAAIDAGQVYGLALAAPTPSLSPIASLDEFVATAALDVDGERLIRGSNDWCSGAVQTLVPSDTGWTEEALFGEFLPQRLGAAVAIHGDVAVAGAPSSTPAFEYIPHGCPYPTRLRGEAIFYEREGGVWTEAHRLVPHFGGRLGAAVALDGETAALGAPAPVYSGTFQQGRVVVVRRAHGEWAAQGALTGSMGSLWDGFGTALVLKENRLIVGAPGTLLNDVDAGATYVFESQQGAFVEAALLTANETEAGSRFGSEVLLDGDLLFVSAPGDGVEPALPGSVHVFHRSSDGWNEISTIRPCNELTTGFGRKLDVRNGVLAVSADDAVFLYVRAGNRWVRAETLRPEFTPRDICFAGEQLIVATTLALEIYALPRSSPSFCDSTDGSLASCPCANPGVPDAGCETPFGAGGVRLDVVSQSDTGPNEARLRASGFSPGSLASGTLLRSRFLEPGGPVVFGDGLRCLALPVIRVDAGQGTGGTIDFTVRHGPEVGPGTFFYQLHFRSTPAAYCDQTAAFNMSSGRAVTWR